MWEPRQEYFPDDLESTEGAHEANQVGDEPSLEANWQCAPVSGVNLASWSGYGLLRKRAGTK